MSNTIDEALRHADIDLSILLGIEGEIPADVRDGLRKTLDLIDRAKAERSMAEMPYMPTMDEAIRFMQSNPQTTIEYLRRNGTGPATPTEIERAAEKVATDCIIAIRKARAASPITDRGMRETIQLHVENALSKAVLGSE